MASPLFVGFEIGGTKLQTGLGRGDGKLLGLERCRVDSSRGAAGIREQLRQLTETLLAKASVTRDEITALGIGFGGPVDSERGVVTKSHQIEGWEQFPLAGWARSTLGFRVVSLHNDADTAALGEARFGAGVGYSPVLYVTVGSGIGGGLVIGGKIYRGAGAGALEIGHLWVVDRSSSDLDVVKLEDVASGWSIGRAARRYAERQIAEGRNDWRVVELAGGDLERIDAVLVARAAAEGDQEASYLLRTAVNAMAVALNQAVTLVAPHRIILGGGVSLIGEPLWYHPIRSLLNTYVFPAFRGTFDVVAPALGEEVVVHGALALAQDAAQSSQ
jgi:glucokinase